MNPKSNEKSVFRGIIPPMITPLLNEDQLDHEGLERLIEHIITGGVHGLFISGTTGEGPSLSYHLRRELIQRSAEIVNGRVPLLVGITDTSFVESIRIAQYAAEQGANALVLATPYYFPAGQPELLEYLQHLVPQLPLPVFLYNMPSHTKLFFEPETVRHAAEMNQVVGLKDSSGNMIYFHQLQILFENRPEFSLLIGPEELLAETLLLGGHGGVCGGANMFPKLYVDMYHSAMKKELDRVMSLHRTIMRIRATIYSVGKYGSSYLKGVKCALSCMGICNDFMAEPFHRFKKEERSRIEEYIREIQLLLKSTDSHQNRSI